ncbi:MAG: hypothetical protein N2315_08635 [Thermanaerothrix sp.]|nr:hypothetical protein [Thermanaerothrix sp.]
MTTSRRLVFLAGIVILALILGAWLAQGDIAIPGIRPANPGEEAAMAETAAPEDEAAKYAQQAKQEWIEKTRQAYARAKAYFEAGELEKARIVAMRGVHFPPSIALAAIEEEVEPPYPVVPEGPSGAAILAYFPEGETLRFFYIPSGSDFQVFYFEPLPGQDRFGVKWVGLATKAEPFTSESPDTLSRYLAAAGYMIQREVGERPTISGPLTGYYDPPFSYDTLRVTIPADPQPADGYKIWEDFLAPRASKIKDTYRHLPDGSIVPAF